MSLFGPREPCLHCGHKVSKPKDPDEFLCPRCQEPGPWATAHQIDQWQSDEAERARIAAAQALAQERFSAALANIESGGHDDAILAELPALAGATGLGEQELQERKVRTFDAVAQAAVADDLLTPEENTELNRLAKALNVTTEWVAHVDPQLPMRITIAGVNGGILPEVSSPHILAKKGEIVHFECQASLMKEVAVRQWQGGSSGFSFPIGKSGIRYRVGGTRGHTVEVGTRLNVADSGILSVTNKRAVYAGSRKTMEMPYSKLVNLSVYTDGVQFHLSNRVNAPIFTMRSDLAHLIAAIVNGAAQASESGA